MSEEQMRILKMLSENKITVEQAEGLLEALDKGQQPQSGPAQEAMDKLGKVVGGLVGGVDGIAWGAGPCAAEAGEEAAPEGLELPEDAEMVLKVRNGRVSIRRGQESRKVQFATESGPRPRVRMDGKTCRVSVGPDTGDTEMSVPRLRKLTIRLTGGRVDADSLGCSIRANAKGGDLKIVDCDEVASVKCMGGTISVSGHPDRLDATCMGGSVTLDGVLIDGGRHKVKVMGGDMTVLLSPGSSLRIETSTLGGGVSTDLERVGGSGGHVRQAAEYRMGEGEGLLSISVLGGAVNIAEAEAAGESVAETVEEQA